MRATNQSLDRGLSILEFLDGAGQPCGVREIARGLDLGSSITQRLVQTLLEKDFVEQIPETRKYRLGYRAKALGAQSYDPDLVTQTARKHLVRLVEEEDVNGYFGVLKREVGVYLLTIPSRQRLIVRADPGESFPLHATALGRVLLSSLAAEDAEAILTSVALEEYTDKTTTDPQSILSAVQKVGENGFTIVDGEYLPGIRSVAAPVFDESAKVIGAISIAYSPTTTKIASRRAQRMICETAAAISRELGHSPDVG